MGNAVTNPARFIEKKVFNVPREKSLFVDHSGDHHQQYALIQQQQAQAKLMAQQLEEQRRQTEEMLRQLRLEEEARKRENQQFQEELARMAQEDAAERAAHESQMKHMERTALESRLFQTNQHIHDIQNDVTRCAEKYNELKTEVENKAVQVHLERMKIAHFEFERNDPSIKSIVVLGMTGDGKSTLCNRLCGDDSKFGEEGPFIVSGSIDSETIVVEKQIYERGGVRISVVDTPGIADSQSRDREHVNNVITYLRGSNGVNQFLLVKNIANPRFNNHYQEMLCQFEHFLGEEFWGFVTVVLTCVDGHNARKFPTVKAEVIRQLAEDHPFTRNRELPVVGVGFDNYEAPLIDLVVNIIGREKYQCKYLTSPLDDLKKELEELKINADNAYQDLERARSTLRSLEQQKKDVERRLT